MDVDPVTLRRSIGYVIQQIGLFPHWTIADNIATVPQLLGWDAARIAARVDELLALVGMDPATVSRPLPARAVGRPEAARRRRARARGRSAGDADGRAVRRHRSDHARAACRTSSCASCTGSGRRSCSSRTTSTRRSGWAIASRSCATARSSSTTRRRRSSRAPADAFVEAFVGTDRALKRLALIAAADAAMRADRRRRHVHAIAAAASLRDALALMLAQGVDALAVTGPGGAPRGVLTLAGIRARTRTTSSGDAARGLESVDIASLNGATHAQFRRCRRRAAPPPSLRSPRCAQDTKVAIGISGWTGFAPLTLAKEAGIFKKNGLDVTLKKIPQKDRHLAIASGDVQCAATTVETWIVWNANGVATTQIFQLDKSYGADGMAVRNNIAKITDLKGKTVAASAPGHRALLHARLVPQEERPVGEGRHRRQPRARGRRAGVRRRPERRRDDLRAVSVDGARQAARPARSSPPRSTIRW